MAEAFNSTTFDPGIYIDTVTALGFKPYAQVIKGKMQMRELMPKEPLSVRERALYLALQSASFEPGGRHRLLCELVRRGLVKSRR